MSRSADDNLRKLAARFGLLPAWQGIDGKMHHVSPSTLRSVLNSFNIEATSAQKIHAILKSPARVKSGIPDFVTVTAGQPFSLQTGSEKHIRVLLEGDMKEKALSLSSAGAFRAPRRPGYHRLLIGQKEITLAVAPKHGTYSRDLTDSQKSWGLSAQLYALRRDNDEGLGDFTALRELVHGCGKLGAGALALSPVHAQFSADSYHYSPYSPSSRLWLNVLYIDVAGAWASLLPDQPYEPRPGLMRHETARLIDWAAIARHKLKKLNRLYSTLVKENALSGSDQRAQDFQLFVRQGGTPLLHHALFEALHEQMLTQSPSHWHWRQWPARYRDPTSPACQKFLLERKDRVDFHLFLQWVAAGQLSAVATISRERMKIGLICDIAVGSDSGGSQAWAHQTEMLTGLSIGSPPDDFNADGQNWGITSYSPLGLKEQAYEPFLRLLRSALQYGGGVRIDHILGFGRLWVIPEGAGAMDGVYLTYPLDDLLRLTALESYRMNAFILGEDLGTVPEGFRGRLDKAAVAGMQVMWFQRAGDCVISPGNWSPTAVGMTTTHDLPTVAGWWRGHDLNWRRKVAKNSAPLPMRSLRDQRRQERSSLWASLKKAGVAKGIEPGPDDTAPVVDAAISFLGKVACDLVILPLEDALGLEDQPNLPGTTTEHPNWRRRLPINTGNICRDQLVKKRLQRLHRR